VRAEWFTPAKYQRMVVCGPPKTERRFSGFEGVVEVTATIKQYMERGYYA